jgi:hypothetical protein
MAVPVSRGIERTNLVLQQQHHAMIDRIRPSLALLQRSYQVYINPRIL